MPFWKKKDTAAGEELRAGREIDKDSFAADFIRLLLSPEEMTPEKVMQIPVVDACISMISYAIAQLPIKLYKKVDGKAEEITDDKRTYLLNTDTGDTLTPFQFWRAICEDYFLRKGGYAYINRQNGEVESIHYVEENKININHSIDPIFKDYNIMVMGKSYLPFQFLKFLRNTKNGWDGIPITERNRLAFSVAYNTLRFENSLMKKGGNKKGFLDSEAKLSPNALNELKENWKNTFSNNEENMMVLNKGLSFVDTSISPREMQVFELKKTEGGELAMLFGVPAALFYGEFTEYDSKLLTEKGIVPLLTDFESSLDRDLLLESEKGTHFFAFDTKELTRGGLKERFEAYAAALKSKFLQVDEVREFEDLEPLGMNLIELGLGAVLFDPKTGDIYTPNTNETRNIKNLTGKGGNEEIEGKT